MEESESDSESSVALDARDADLHRKLEQICGPSSQSSAQKNIFKSDREKMRMRQSLINKFIGYWDRNTNKAMKLTSTPFPNCNRSLPPASDSMMSSISIIEKLVDPRSQPPPPAPPTVTGSSSPITLSSLSDGERQEQEVPPVIQNGPPRTQDRMVQTSDRFGQPSTSKGRKSSLVPVNLFRDQKDVSSSEVDESQALDILESLDQQEFMVSSLKSAKVRRDVDGPWRFPTMRTLPSINAGELSHEFSDETFRPRAGKRDFTRRNHLDKISEVLRNRQMHLLTNGCGKTRQDDPDDLSQSLPIGKSNYLRLSKQSKDLEQDSQRTMSKSVDSASAVDAANGYSGDEDTFGIDPSGKKSKTNNKSKRRPRLTARSGRHLNADNALEGDIARGLELSRIISKWNHEEGLVQAPARASTSKTGLVNGDGESFKSVPLGRASKSVNKSLKVSNVGPDDLVEEQPPVPNKTAKNRRSGAQSRRFDSSDEDMPENVPVGRESRAVNKEKERLSDVNPEDLVEHNTTIPKKATTDKRPAAQSRLFDSDDDDIPKNVPVDRESRGVNKSRLPDVNPEDLVEHNKAIPKKVNKDKTLVARSRLFDSGDEDIPEKVPVGRKSRSVNKSRLPNVNPEDLVESNTPIPRNPPKDKKTAAQSRRFDSSDEDIPEKVPVGRKSRSVNKSRLPDVNPENLVKKNTAIPKKVTKDKTVAARSRLFDNSDEDIPENVPEGRGSRSVNKSSLPDVNPEDLVENNTAISKKVTQDKTAAARSRLFDSSDEDIPENVPVGRRSRSVNKSRLPDVNPEDLVELNTPMPKKPTKDKITAAQSRRFNSSDEDVPEKVPVSNEPRAVNKSRRPNVNPEDLVEHKTPITKKTTKDKKSAAQPNNEKRNDGDIPENVPVGRRTRSADKSRRPDVNAEDLIEHNTAIPEKVTKDKRSAAWSRLFDSGDEDIPEKVPVGRETRAVDKSRRPDVSAADLVTHNASIPNKTPKGKRAAAQSRLFDSGGEENSENVSMGRATRSVSKSRRPDVNPKDLVRHHSPIPKKPTKDKRSVAQSRRFDSGDEDIPENVLVGESRSDNKKRLPLVVLQDIVKNNKTSPKKATKDTRRAAQSGLFDGGDEEIPEKVPVGRELRSVNKSRGPDVNPEDLVEHNTAIPKKVTKDKRSAAQSGRFDSGDEGIPENIPVGRETRSASKSKILNNIYKDVAKEQTSIPKLTAKGKRSAAQSRVFDSDFENIPENVPAKSAKKSVSFSRRTRNKSPEDVAAIVPHRGDVDDIPERSRVLNKSPMGLHIISDVLLTGSVDAIVEQDALDTNPRASSPKYKSTANRRKGRPKRNSRQEVDSRLILEGSGSINDSGLRRSGRERKEPARRQRGYVCFDSEKDLKIFTDIEKMKTKRSISRSRTTLARNPDPLPPIQEISDPDETVPEEPVTGTKVKAKKRMPEVAIDTTCGTDRKSRKRASRKGPVTKKPSSAVSASTLTMCDSGTPTPDDDLEMVDEGRIGVEEDRAGDDHRVSSSTLSKTASESRCWRYDSVNFSEYRESSDVMVGCAQHNTEGTIGFIRIKPMGVKPCLKMKNRDVSLLVLEGRGKIIFDDQTLNIAPYDGIELHKGSQYSLHNVDKDEYLVIHFRLGNKS